MVAAPVICTCFPRGSMADTGWCFFSLVLPSPDWMMAQRIEHCKGQNPCQLLQAATQGGSAAIPQLKAAPPIRRSAAAVTPHERDLASKRDTEPQDHCSSSCQRELNDEEWGLPVLNCVRWDWKGPPTSMTTTGKRNRRKEDSLPKSDDIDNNDGFYCRVELRGSHVLAGLRAWQE